MKGVFFAPGAPAADTAEAMAHLKSAHPLEAAVLWVYDSSLATMLRDRQIPTWLGGAYIPYSGPGSRYYEGIMDPSWRWSSIQENVRVAREALQTIEPVGWYITEENDLKAMAANEPFRQVIEAYLIELMRQLYDLRPLPFLWSPWASGLATTSARSALERTVVGARNWIRGGSGGASIPRPVNIEVHLQDGVGAGHHTAAEAVAWGTRLSSIPTLPVRMNLELFRVGASLLPTAGDREEILKRESLYRLHGLAIGAQWEARYWRYPGGYVSGHGEP